MKIVEESSKVVNENQLSSQSNTTSTTDLSLATGFVLWDVTGHVQWQKRLETVFGGIIPNQCEWQLCTVINEINLIRKRRELERCTRSQPLSQEQEKKPFANSQFYGTTYKTLTIVSFCIIHFLTSPPISGINSRYLQGRSVNLQTVYFQVSFDWISKQLILPSTFNYFLN